MKAAIYTQYGGPEVVRIEDVPKPSPKDNEILIKVKATTVSAGDWRVRSLDLPPGFGPIGRLMFGVFKPRQPILGADLAGVVEATGQAVTKFKIGDAVFAMSGAHMGCHAEYKCLPEDGAVVLKPDTLNFEEAAALPFGGTTALHFLRKAKLQPGETVLVNGASGAVGTAAIQLAKHFGAQVTGVCSTANVELVRSLGADHVIDYTQEDFTQNSTTYDVIVETAGTAPFKRSQKSLSHKGRLLLVLGSMPDMLRSVIHSRTIICGVAPEKAEDLQTLAELTQADAYKPVIDRTYPLDQIVEAHRHVDTGHKRGNVVITLN